LAAQPAEWGHFKLRPVSLGGGRELQQGTDCPGWGVGVVNEAEF
jgi:hypothetical protein